MTKQGLKAIEEIQVGDQVLSYNDNLEIFEYKDVIEVYNNETTELCHIYTETEEIVCTPNHSVLTVEGCFDIVLWARMDGLDHVFQTQTDGVCSCKSPEGMFDKIIPNDCKTVDTAIRNYYGYTTTSSKKADK